MYHSNKRYVGKEKEPFVLFSYARPGHVRKCLELISLGLTDAKKILGNRIRIVTAGAGWDPSAYGLDGVLQNLGLLPYAETGQLYRSVDAGLVAMSTPHPSYLPFELMACGAAVITNRNSGTTWLLEDNKNCILFELTRSSICNAVCKAIEMGDGLGDIAIQGSRTIESGYADWKTSCDRVAQIILRTGG